MIRPAPLGAWALLLALVALLPGTVSAIGPRKLLTSGGRRAEPGVLNIHLVPHTHDDAGWLKTVDQYYYGSNSSIQIAGVQYILDSVVASLQANPDRRFVYGELSFFSRWWAEQSDGTRDAVRALLASGQLSFVNGGYVQHDEATTHYVAMIDQTTRGHRWLARELDLPPPRVGWQIDPFGHSRTHSSMMAKWGAIDALFFGRIDHQDRAIRSADKALEMVWEAGPSVGPDGNCFTGAFFTGVYLPPPGFHWEQGHLDAPMQDDPCLADYNVESRLADFAAIADKVAGMHQGEDIMFTMGDDFNYMNANHWFKNLDKLIHHLNSHPEYSKRYNAFYSTPEDYVAAKHASNITWPTKRDDFFPYADCDHCYWTGYFSSKAASKRYIRAATSYLQAARQLEAAVGRAERLEDTTDSLEEAVSLLQHHDGITGTAKKHTVNDYHRRLAAGWAAARAVVARAVQELLAAPPRLRYTGRGPAAPVHSRRLWPASVAAPQDKREPYPVRAAVLGECPLLNVSMCGISVERLAPGGPGLRVLLYNPLAWPRLTPVRVPLGADGAVAVIDAAGKPVVSQILPLSPSTRSLQHQEQNAGAAPQDAGDKEVVFMAHLEPLAFGEYIVRPVEAGHPHAAVESQVQSVTAGAGDGHQAISNGLISLEFDTESGKMVRVADESAGGWSALHHEFLFYESSIGEEEENPGQASGAYIFRPAGVGQVGNGTVKLDIIQGPVVSEARQVHSHWAASTHRLWANHSHVESEWTVGPIPVEEGVGKEVVSRWRSDVKSGDVFWTDANGREMMERKLNYRPSWDLDVKEPIAGNFYPITAAVALRDTAGSEMYVVTDRAQAAASLASGQMEFMVHRRTTKDDGRGVAEPLDETTCDCHDCACAAPTEGLTIRGTHLVGFAPSDGAAQARRTAQQLANDPPLLIFLDVPPAWGGGVPSLLLAGASPFADDLALPSSVQLVTLMETETGSVLLRLAHLYELAEGGEPECVDVDALLGGITSMQELALTGVPPTNLATRRRWVVPSASPRSEPPETRSSSAACGGRGKWSIELQPMDIRTFEVELVGGGSAAY